MVRKNMEKYVIAAAIGTAVSIGIYPIQFL